jgi:hypothetical protein
MRSSHHRSIRYSVYADDSDEIFKDSLCIHNRQTLGSSHFSSGAVFEMLIFPLHRHIQSTRTKAVLHQLGLDTFILLSLRLLIS